ncbi:MAG: trypsin-like peptidase domain-containing protein [Bacteroidaceae bacterium]|nr:trypsin-like peptidase domain-containing protein [Bacteroidaceae bacterium]
MKAFLSKFNVLLLLGVLLAFVSCEEKVKQKPLTLQNIEAKHTSGVVLIKNTYYYTITFDGGATFYFTGIKEDGTPENLTLDLDEITPNTIFGTGFFITKDGMIATNSHVITPMVDVESVRSTIVEAIGYLANECTKEVNDLNEQLGMLRLAILATDDYYEEQELSEKYEELQEERDEYQEFINNAQSLRGKECKYGMTQDIGIAYNDTHVSSTSDFVGCVELKDNPEKDLAIIQLKSKVTPEGKYVFKVPETNNATNSKNKEDLEDEETSTTGKGLHMIGFNLGPNLALTEQGIKAQITSGEISQDTDATQIMYTIPSLPGSSGSPVIDRYGKLVAINHAGISSTQNFNYGIKAIHLRKMLNEVLGK